MFTEHQMMENRAFERAWLKPFTDTIPEWDSLRYTQRFLGRPGKQFVLWSLSNTLDPVFIDLYAFTDFQVDLNGPRATLSGEYTRKIHLGPAPQQVLGNSVYLWIPAFFDLRYTPYSYAQGNPLIRQLTWRFCVKMPSNPEMLDRRKPGQVFFTELADFRKLWPDTPG